jgi:hypothetical protein
MSVDLPDPDGPMMAVKRPAGNPTVTSSSARTAVSPAPWTLVAATTRAAMARSSPGVVEGPPGGVPYVVDGMPRSS